MARQALTCGAMAAMSRHLDNRSGSPKALLFSPACQSRKTLRRVQFGDRPAALADEERRRLPLMRMRAGDIGIAALDLVHEAVRQQKIKRPVDRDGSRARAMPGHPVDEFVGAGRRMALSDAGEHVAPLRRQPGSAPPAKTLGARDQIFRTMTMIMTGIGKRHGPILLQKNRRCHFLPKPNATGRAGSH